MACITLMVSMPKGSRLLNAKRKQPSLCSMKRFAHWASTQRPWVSRVPSLKSGQPPRVKRLTMASLVRVPEIGLLARMLLAAGALLSWQPPPQFVLLCAVGAPPCRWPPWLCAPVALPTYTGGERIQVLDVQVVIARSKIY
jgi:hypothetical protein